MLQVVQKIFLKSIGGSRNDRIVRGRMRLVRERINALEEAVSPLTDEQMRLKTREFKQRLSKGAPRAEILPEAFACVREACRRATGMRHFDVQLVAGMVLDEGWIAEEATGEGKTISCYPAIYMAVLDGMHVHVVTVNDYLVHRDAEQAKQVFERLGVTVGFITQEMGTYGPEAQPRKDAYACDVTYGMNSEFGFDYLRDNTKTSAADQAQGPLDFAIIDEVDNILIDEARTPLILSGPAYGQTDRFRKADAVAREVIARNRLYDQANRRVEALKREIKSLNGELSKVRGEEARKIESRIEQAQDQMSQAEEELAHAVKHYEIELDRKAVHMTHEGVTEAQEIAGIGSFYVGANMEWPHLMEQALRAHIVFEKDKDYVVQQGAVKIVDEFTGRILEGRQWSDGLHQAVEAKERVTIKEENQTMATITYQNFFKLYKKLAGMTGTAMTEAGEFLKIYKLDVASVPTNRPVNRVDHNDRIYSDESAKYNSIAEEINKYSKAGRPVLVGTTSIEKSEHISEMLTHRYGVEHQVLNARPENVAREADIVAMAGTQRPLKKDSKQMVGAVTIATNMAGRGTDIKLGPGVVYEKCRVPPAEELARLGVEAESLYPPGCNKCCIFCQQYDPATDCGHCFKPKLDGDFPTRGRTACREEVPCGLHIVGTERHEARRIDNQLRGRSGRQGDPGSARFFISLRDELMTNFAGEWTLKVLGWLGLQGDVAIEDRRVSKGIARAQKKVEERNFEMRKNLLEYDEVMDYQRHAFYGWRQQILLGRQVELMVMDMLDGSISGAVAGYLDGKFAARCIAEWARKNLLITITEDQIRADSPEDLPNLEDQLRIRAKEEAVSTVSMTLGEYMGEDLPPEDWDLKALSAWAMSRFNVNLSQNQLRKMTPEDVDKALGDGAAQKIDQIDFSPLVRYLEEDFARESLALWARNKFLIEVSAQELAPDAEAAEEVLRRKVHEAYARREIEYPVEYAMEMTVGQAGMDNVYALGALVEWANRKYDAGLKVEDLQGRKADEVRRDLVDLSAQWLSGDRLDKFIREALGAQPDAAAAAEFARARFDTRLEPKDIQDGHALEAVTRAGRNFLRREMTELERFVLLQLYDGAWVDHLLAMDHLKSSIGLRGFAERDPKVAYKIDGSQLFEEMVASVREKVTDAVFKVRLRAGDQMASAYRISQKVHQQLSGYDHLTQGMDMAAAAQPEKVATIVREMPRVGRNDPCPCGSGKKYKKCHGQGQA